MATSITFTWTAPPDVIIGNVDRLDQHIIEGLGQLADVFAARMESYAKANAPWTDRTGAARQGLHAFAQKETNAVTLYLVTSVAYGVFLETGTRYMAPRAIILPTLQAHFGEIMAAARALLSGA